MTRGVTISLTPIELCMAKEVAFMRRLASREKNLNTNRHADKSDWATDMDGALAEMAVSKALGVYWGGDEGTFKKPDVMSVQVRSTCHQSGGLIIRPNDAEEETYLLCVTDCPRIRICGWLRGFEVKQKVEFDPDRKWWKADQTMLRPFDVMKWRERIARTLCA